MVKQRELTGLESRDELYEGIAIEDNRAIALIGELRRSSIARVNNMRE